MGRIDRYPNLHITPVNFIFCQLTYDIDLEGF